MSLIEGPKTTIKNIELPTELVINLEAERKEHQPNLSQTDFFELMMIKALASAAQTRGDQLRAMARVDSVAAMAERKARQGIVKQAQHPTEGLQAAHSNLGGMMGHGQG